jgi:hypothetical protein
VRGLHTTPTPTPTPLPSQCPTDTVFDLSLAVDLKNAEGVTVLPAGAILYVNVSGDVLREKRRLHQQRKRGHVKTESFFAISRLRVVPNL